MIWPQANPVWLILLAVLCICAWLSLHYWDRIANYLRARGKEVAVAPSNAADKINTFTTSVTVYFVALISVGALIVIVALLLQEDQKNIPSYATDMSIITTDSEILPNVPDTPVREDALPATTDMPSDRVLTPRTPSELIDIAVNQTKRDAMQHKGAWIRIEGIVLDVSEIRERRFDDGEWTQYIQIKVAVDPPPHDPFSRVVELYVEAAKWEQQVARIERGDWLVADGVVHDIYKTFLIASNGDILAVSGANRETQ